MRRRPGVGSRLLEPHPRRLGEHRLLELRQDRRHLEGVHVGVERGREPVARERHGIDPAVQLVQEKRVRGSNAVVHDSLHRRVENVAVDGGAVREVDGHARDGEGLGEILRGLKPGVHSFAPRDALAVVLNKLGRELLEKLELSLRLLGAEEVMALHRGGRGGGRGGSLLVSGHDLGLPVNLGLVRLLVDVGGHRAVTSLGTLQTLGLEPAVVVNLAQVLDAVVGKHGDDGGPVVHGRGEHASGVEVQAGAAAE